MDHDQVRFVGDEGPNRPGDLSDMPVRVGFSPAIEAHGVILIEAEFDRIERIVLPGQDERGGKPERGQRASEGLQFDGFRPGADDQPDIGRPQSSP